MVFYSARPMKIFVSLAIASVLAFGFSCTGSVAHAVMHDSADFLTASVTRLTSSQPECCNAGISKYIGSWRSALATAPPQVRDGLLLLVVALVFVFVARRFRPGLSFSSHHLYSRRLSGYDYPSTSASNHLKLAFSQGILHSKLYA